MFNRNGMIARAVATVNTGLLNIKYIYCRTGCQPSGSLLNSTKHLIIVYFIVTAQPTQIRAAGNVSEILLNMEMSRFYGFLGLGSIPSDGSSST